MKKTLCILLALTFMCTLFLGGCTTEKTEENSKIKVVLMDKGRCSAKEGDMTNNRWTKYIVENSGVDIEFIAVARDDFEENLNRLLVSGTIPDVMVTYESTYVQQLIEQDLIQPIGPLLDEYSTTCKEYLTENPELVDFLTFNGELYAMSNKRATTLDQGMWIRQDWLDAVNMTAPTTVDEFLDVCRAFKEAKLGGENTVPLAMTAFPWDYFAPLYAAHDFWYVTDGQVEYGTLTNRFESATQFMKTMYDEGLISREFAIDTDSSLATQNWVSGKSGILLHKTSPLLMQELLENNPDANPVPLAPFATEYGTNGFHQSEMMNLFVMVSSQCKNPQAVIKYLDWMLSDGWYVMEHGLEGVHYNLDENGYPVAISTDEVNEQMRYPTAYEILAQNTVTPESIMASAAPDEMSQKIAALEVLSMQVNSNYTYRRDLPRSPDVDEYGVLYADWSLLEKQYMVRAITGGDTYSTADMMKDLKSEWKTLGGENVQKQIQDWYDTYYKD